MPNNNNSLAFNQTVQSNQQIFESQISKHDNEDRSYVYPTLDRDHLKELLASGINPEIIALGSESLTYSESIEFLYQLKPLDRLNAGRLTSASLRKTMHLEDGSLRFKTLDPLTNFEKISPFGRIKPRTPRAKWDADKKQTIQGKFNKYESVLGASADPEFVPIPDKLWQEFIDNTGVPKGDTRNFWEWVEINPQLPIYITEGWKKAACLLSNGYITISLPGINQGYISENVTEDGERIRSSKAKDIKGYKKIVRTLVPSLARFTHSARHFIFAFDQDNLAKTLKGVRNAILNTGNLLIAKGCQVSVLGAWQGQDKGVDDLIVNQGIGAFEAAFQATNSLSVWHYRVTHSLEKYQDILLVDERYLPDLSKELEKAQLIAFKSMTGTGKTQLVKKLREHHQTRPLIIPNLRQSLTEKISEDFGVPTHHELVKTPEGKMLGFVAPTDSFHEKSLLNLSPEEMELWQNREFDLFFDEVCQVYFHTFFSNTSVANNRVEIIENLNKFIKYCIANGGKIYLADADLSEDIIDYFKREVLEFDAKVAIVENIYQPYKGRKAFISYAHNPTKIIDLIIQSAKKGERIYVFLSGQKHDSLNGTINLELELIKQGIAPDKILRIDSATIGDKGHPAFQIASTDEKLNDFQIVLASPTMATGVSLDASEHIFDKVFGISYGIIGVVGLLQGIERVRCDADRYIWVAKTANGNGCKLGKGETTYKGIQKSQDSKMKSNLAQLKNITKDKGISSEQIEEFFLSEGDAAAIKDLMIKMACEYNTLQVAHRESILARMVIAGYEIVDIGELSKNDSLVIQNSLKATRDESLSKHHEAIIATKIEDDSYYQELEKKNQLNPTEQLQIKAHYIRKVTGETNITKELIELVQNLPTLRNCYLIRKGIDGIKIAEEQDWYTFEKLRKKKMFSFDIIKKFRSVDYSILIDKLKLYQFLSEENVVTEKLAASYLLALREVVRDKEFSTLPLSREVRSIAFRDWGKNAIKGINALLSLILGKNLPSLGRIRVDGKQVYQYGSGIGFSDLELKVFANWDQQHQEKMDTFNSDLDRIKRETLGILKQAYKNNIQVEQIINGVKKVWDTVIYFCDEVKELYLSCGDDITRILFDDLRNSTFVLMS